ncbi:MAG: 50S ribosomal protein L5 [Candidatus Kaiserbacteria bacterium]|nr:50S ribosomal protein L5 [Candidatus Kaiserbacteria bacterium]
MATATTQNKIFEAMKGEFGYKSSMQTPRIQKVIVSSGVGAKHDKNKREVIIDRLAKITGQAPAQRQAKKSIASFKIREGDIVGYQITLRGARMKSFLDKLIHVVLPRVKDFRGLKASAIDEMGNMTIGIREHTVFPETADEDARDVFGLSITITTNVKDKKEAEAFLRHIGIPLRS